jgi:undecaprenyl-diphosphatase
MSTVFIFGAKYLFIVSLIIGVIYFLRQPRQTQINMLKLAIVSLPLIYLVAVVAGHVYYNPRPFVVGHFIPLIPHVADNGFPSDHALLVSAIAIIVTLFSKRVGILLWIIAAAVAISRVYVGIHHVADVIGSAVIATAVTLAVFYWMKKNRNPLP